jgi:hypothetical protein
MKVLPIARRQTDRATPIKPDESRLKEETSSRYLF